MIFDELIRRFMQQYKLLLAEDAPGTGSTNGDPPAGEGDPPPQGGDNDPIIEIEGDKFTQEDILQWREDSANKGKWQKEYTQRDQDLAEQRKTLSQEKPPVTQRTTETPKADELTGKMIEEALGEDGNDFHGLAALLTKREKTIMDDIKEEVTTGIKTEQSQDGMVRDFINRHKEWDEYTAPGGKVTQYLNKMPEGYPPEGAFLEVLLIEERESKAALIEEAKKQGFKLGETKATKEMEVKGRIKTLRGTPPAGKQTETALDENQQDKSMVDTLKRMRKET